MMFRPQKGADMPTAMTGLRAAVIWSLGALAAQAEGPVDPAVLAGPCANCHGPDGRSTGAIPSIAGLDASETAARLRAFRAGQVPGATVMPRLMKGYDDAQIEMLAQWFAKVTP